MTKLVLGTVQFGLDYGVNNSSGKYSFEKVKSVLDFAFLNNITEIDTADLYGDSQELIKSYEDQSPFKFKIMSKFVLEKDKSFEDLLFNTRKRLNREKIEGYYFHRFEDFSKFDEVESVLEMKRANQLDMLGLSLYSLNELERAINTDWIDIIQLPLNLLDCAKEKQVLLKKAKEKGKKIYIRSAFLQGLFFKDVNALPSILIPLKDNLIYLNKLAKNHSLTMEELCLGYIKSKNFIDGVLIGVDNLEQLQSNIKSFEVNLDSKLVDEIERNEVLCTHLLNPSNWNGK